MKMSSLVAKKYGYALFEVGMEENKLDELYSEVQTVMEVFRTDTDLSRVLEHPDIRKQEKKSLLNKIFSDQVSKEILNLLYITVDKKRANKIVEILEEFFQLFREERKIKKAVVTSAIPLEEESLHALQTVLEKKTNNTIVLENKIDPTIIGGVILEMDERKIDSSIFTELKQLQYRLKTVSL